MKKVKFLKTCCFSFFISFFIGYFFVSVQLVPDMMSEKIHHPKTAYFTLWATEAIKNHYALKKLANELSKPENGCYAISTNPPPKEVGLYNENDLNIVAWKEFDIPIPKIKSRSYLWQIESPISITVPPTEEYKTHFNKIFTWHKPSCDGKNIIFVPIPYNYNTILLDYDIKKKHTLLMQVAKYSTQYNYIERSNMVRWFLENHPDDILFYGKGWDFLKPKLSEKAQKKFDLKYGGYIKDKIKTISFAKFVLAFENERFEDYVTEKIYDVMAAGSVPIYSGAPNIRDYVPDECFIDFHHFKDYSSLYKYISTMDDETYMGYLNCIRTFMSEPKKHSNHPVNVIAIIRSNIDDK